MNTTITVVTVILVILVCITIKKHVFATKLYFEEDFQGYHIENDKKEKWATATWLAIAIDFILIVLNTQ